MARRPANRPFDDFLVYMELVPPDCNAVRKENHMDRFSTHPKTLSGKREGPLGLHIDELVQQLSQQISSGSGLGVDCNSSPNLATG
jgi:hypothetical protein